MKIIVCGAGEVGTHLAKLLSEENINITLMDSDVDKLDFPTYSEILTITGNSTSIKDLKIAGVKDADIFIAVTPEEATNLTSCILAHALGAKRTIARISNTEYLQPVNVDFFANLGIDSLICPELLAASEIISSLKKPWARQWWDISDGKLVLVGIKVRNNAPIVNKYLYEIGSTEKRYHIVAIKRGKHTIIPRGNDQVHAEDLVYFITTKDNTEYVKTEAGKEDVEIEKVTIMGGGRIAMQVCQFLPQNLQAKLIEIDKEKSYRIAEQLPNNIMVINGDGRNTELLIQENIRNSDAFISLTGNSETNILACVSAKNFGVSKTIAEVENLDYIQMAENLNIGNIINKKLIASSHIYQFLLDADVSTVKFLTFANADVAELVARTGSKITKKPVKDLKLPLDINLGGRVTPDGKAEIIDGNTIIEAGDHVVAFCLGSGIRKLADFFE
jgi:K+ transport systems, NAD-binding component